MLKYYVVLDHEDPGAEFASWEEAAEYLRPFQRKYPEAIIVSTSSLYKSEEWWGDLDVPYWRKEW